MSEQTTPLKAELLRRWQQIFSALECGEDVSPGQRLRAEGVMEAAVMTGEASTDALLAAMDSCYVEIRGCSLADEFGEDWREFYPFPQIPGFMQRAPVYPSTSD